MLWIACAAVAVVVVSCAAYFVQRTPQLDQRVLDGLEQIAQEHHLKRLPDDPTSTSQIDYVYLGREYEAKGISQAEALEIFAKVDDLCIDWQGGFWNRGPPAYGWGQDRGLMGGQTVQFKWFSEPFGDLSIVYQGQKRNYRYLIRGLLSNGSQPE